MAINNVLLANESYLVDREFLTKLDRIHNKVIYAKIISLTLDEDPIEEIQGRVTQGSVSIDGKSCVRRTCSVSLVANELNIHAYYWSINTKFQFYIGVQNSIEPKYPEICWFKMGTYYISSFSTSQTVNSYTISIQGKDKMCMLNGELGGVITPLTWDFGNIEEIQNDGSKVITKYLIKNIITEAVHEHAREPFQNIIVNDLDDLALELLEYRGDKTMYLLYNINKDIVTNFFIPMNEDEQIEDYAPNLKNSNGITKFSEVKFDPRVSAFKLDEDSVQKFTKFYIKNGNQIETDENNATIYYSMFKVEYGETIGYRLTDLTYPGDLISNVGESVTSMLDKIVSMLGNYEYFYNLDGQFIFQRKAVYYEASWNNIVKKSDIEYHLVDAGEAYSDNKIYFEKDGTIMREYYYNDAETWNKLTSQGLMYYVTDYENYVDNTLSQERWTYNFNDGILVTSFSNAPNILNLKNDYSIWGVRKGVTGAEIPIHLRYAIDKKPKYYKTFDGISYATEEGKEEVLRMYDQAMQEVRSGAQTITIPNELSIFQKEEVPQYLQKSDGSSEWWDLLNWAEYYKLLTEEYPSAELSEYGTKAFRGTIQFPNNSSQTFYGQLIFDVYRDTKNPYTGLAQFRYERNGTVGSPMQVNEWHPFQHGFGGCHHTYAEFIYLNQNNNMQSFIYNPIIPASVHPTTDEAYIIIDDGTTDIAVEEIRRIKELYERDVNIVDWRELIYQMALDYRKHNHDEDFHLTLANNNQLPDGISWCSKGYTGYEPYYIDLEGFWRALYDPDYTCTPQISYVTQLAMNTNDGYKKYYTWKQNTDTHINQLNKDYYYRDYLGRYVKVKSTLDKINERMAEDPGYYWYLQQMSSGADYDPEEDYYILLEDEFDPNSHWSREVLENPSGLNFWFDFLDGDLEFDQYAVQVIGDRPKAENDTNVKAIYFRDIPDVIFVDSTTSNAMIQYQQEQRPGYEYIRLPEYLNNLFSVSRQGKSAMDKLDTFLYNYACCTESITINSLPIYYLEPNTRIFVDDNNSNLHGEYLIERMTIPLSNNGTMSITATKAIERLY